MITSIDIKIYIYTGVIIVLHILYIFLYVGMGNISKEFVQKLNTFVQIGVGLFLFIKFFPLLNHKLEPGDGAIIFGCSMFILTNAGITEFILKQIENGVLVFTGINFKHN